VGIIGEPATGKTTVMREVLKRLGDDYTLFKYRLVVGRQYAKRGLYVLGIYHDDELFGGTDRLSMAVQPDAIRFLSKVPDKATILFEGDRLTRAGFFQAAGDRLTLFLIETSAPEKSRRHTARHDTQPEQFHRSRATLIDRIAHTFPVSRMRNESFEDVSAIADRVTDTLAI
jgi:hypothetical protein